MRIGVDARELTGRPTGVGRYLAEVLGAWAAAGSGVAGRHEFVLYGPAPLPDGLAARIEALRPAVRVLAGNGGTVWEQRTLPAAASRDALDVFFAPAYTAPLRLPCPVGLAVHDLSFCAHPEWFGWREGLRRRVLTRLAARRAAVVLTDTHFSKGEIQAHLGLPANRIEVIALGAGLPALEAMALGIPVVASNAGALPEVVGDAGLLIDPADVDGLARALERVHVEAGLATRLREAGIDRAGQFSWTESVRTLLQAYEDALGRTVSSRRPKRGARA